MSPAYSQWLPFQRKDILHTGALRKTKEEELMKRAREGAEDGDAEFSVVVSQLNAFSTVYSERFIPGSSLSILPKIFW